MIRTILVGKIPPELGYFSLGTSGLLFIPIDVEAVAMLGALYPGLPAIVQTAWSHQGDVKPLLAADE